MSKLQQIEKALESVNDAVFQDICDAFLYYTQDNYQDITRVGTTIAKQKTSKGTPDTYFLLPNGQYVFVEYTTKDKGKNKTAFLKKAKDDIAKCLNVEITGIPLAKIEKIIFCHNSKLLPKDDLSLKKICADKDIKLELKGINTIAFSLLGRCKHVAKEFLGINIDTGQILPPSIFIEEYENGGLSTPLSNKLYGRVSELTTIAESIKKNPVTILSGAPGVGKSRLVLEALSEIQAQDKKAAVFCMSNKNAPVYEDLRVYLAEDRPYYIFIDDGNRQSDNLESLLVLRKEKRRYPINIVITVRDYALSGVKSICKEYKAVDYELQKLTNEQIREILKGEDFSIQNTEYLNRICDIAQGNPRLAIMAAKVALATQDINSLNDVYYLYEQYFEGATIDRPVLTNKTYSKTIGLLSFFYSIDIENSAFVAKVCSDFSINEYDFKEAITKLEEWELADSTPDNTIFRISDQVLSTYMFYKTFLKDPILNFDVLLKNYFRDFSKRFSDTVIGANSTFGYENVLGTVDNYLSTYWESISNDYDLAMEFLKLFWLYRHEDVLAFVHNINSNLTEVENAEYLYDEDNSNRRYWNKDELLALLCNFFSYKQFDYLDAVELAFEYVKRKPNCFQQLQDAIKQHFEIDIDDLADKCERQRSLLSLFESNIANHNIFERSCLLCIPTFLKRDYWSHSRSRINSKSIPTHGRIVVVDAIKDFRRNVWSFVFEKYSLYKSDFDSVLLTYANNTRDGVKSIYEFDYEFLVRIFRKYFKKSILSDVFIIQTILFKFKRLKIKAEGIGDIKAKFMSKPYQTYLILSHDRLRDKEEHEFDDIHEYERLKAKEIRERFKFKNVSEFKRLYKVYVDICELKGDGFNRVSESLDIIIHEHSLKSPELALAFLKEIIKAGNKTSFSPSRVYSVFFDDSNCIYKQYLDLIKTNEFVSKDWWLWGYYCCIDEKIIELNDCDGLLLLLASTKASFFVNFETLEKYKSVCPDFFVKALSNIIENKKSNNSSIRVWYEIFDKYLKDFEHRIDLLKEMYLLNDSDRDHFDYDCKHLLTIVNLDNTFFIEYIKSIVGDGHSFHLREFDNLSRIWELENAETLFEQAFDYLLSIDVYFTSDSFANSFFKKINPDYTKRAFSFLKKYLKKNIKNRLAINLVLDCARNSFNDLWHTMIIHFLTLESDFKQFQEIQLLNNSFMSNGDVIWADVKSRQLQEILSAVNHIPGKKYHYSRHKNYLKTLIEFEKRQADSERKLKFQHKFWH